MRLGVNIDHVATVRQARQAREPEPVTAALLAELAGADGITVHLRGDRRHIQERDLDLLKEVLSVKLNIEMAATRQMVAIARRVKPAQVTLVPERPNELTTTGGLDVVRHADPLENTATQLREVGVQVSLFIDADLKQVRKARAIGVEAIEINTGPYADSNAEDQQKYLAKVVSAARLAKRLHLEVLAGHGLTYTNIAPIASIEEIVEVNIGHSLVARAVLVGMEQACREMRRLIG
ncbi:MAG: pyridoxine 5'-phosphate synthase [Acidobacteriota bacterium]|nr:pyridoxine 5'-phosphate synthase [Acidobacteriota bacterium]